MKLSKIVNHLQNLLSTHNDREAKYADAVQELVDRLERKEKKLRSKLPDSKSEKETNKINRHIKVCSAQLEKGRAALKELKSQAD